VEINESEPRMKTQEQCTTSGRGWRDLGGKSQLYWDRICDANLWKRGSINQFAFTPPAPFLLSQTHLHTQQKALWLMTWTLNALI